ncbi:hypothetical protein A0J61_11327 [Choanephora cucurbitarum]|uniref:Uncharacterized protein n=1 Tax=Choanephora cucurbitarum TaxID=101091 RepID=A0A1C7MZR1_9FUNG|nr:hypothetical protein A0J61_11327 [Choanephora cucurbitarum]
MAPQRTQISRKQRRNETGPLMTRERARLLQEEVFDQVEDSHSKETSLAEEQEVSDIESVLGEWDSISFDMQAVDEDFSFPDDIDAVEPMDVDEGDEVSFDENDPHNININVSSNPFTPAEINDIRFLELSKSDGLSTGVSDYVREYVNDLLYQNVVTTKNPSQKVSSLSSTIALIKRVISFSPVVEHETCKKGCYLYDLDEDKEVTHCLVCKEARNFTKPTYIKHVSIAKKIAQLLSVDQKREELVYRHRAFEEERLQDNSDLFDIYSGGVYEQMKQ